MTNYSALSNFEINSAVHNSALDVPFQLEFLGGDKIRWTRNGAVAITDKVPYVKNTLLNYCNNPADAWPIILKHKINIDHRASIKAGAMAKLSGNNEIYAVNDNPLRAAMEVYLMAMDAGLLKD